MKREVRLIFTEGEADMLGNDENAETSIAFVGADSFVTMLFGGSDGSARDSITIDEIRDVMERVGSDVGDDGQGDVEHASNQIAAIAELARAVDWSLTPMDDRPVEVPDRGSSEKYPYDLGAARRYQEMLRECIGGLAAHASVYETSVISLSGLFAFVSENDASNDILQETLANETMLLAEDFGFDADAVHNDVCAMHYAQKHLHDEI